ncbi:hypothetical protein QVD17_28677 [Tagetes erecta]|uniref:Uncharacterized protein n=1 Tax=Tagetes erecta TaxID=13708 RepID=A0AAD8NKN9_TARER|nr:hypothetical protein QVD17_28677 [Tagetes erecta]
MYIMNLLLIVYQWGDKSPLRDLHRYKLIQDFLSVLTPSELALPLEERCLRNPLKFFHSKEVLRIQKSEVTFFVPRNLFSKSRRNHYGTGPPLHYQEEANSLFSKPY